MSWARFIAVWRSFSTNSQFMTIKTSFALNIKDHICVFSYSLFAITFFSYNFSIRLWFTWVVAPNCLLTCFSFQEILHCRFKTGLITFIGRKRINAANLFSEDFRIFYNLRVFVCRRVELQNGRISFLFMLLINARVSVDGEVIQWGQGIKKLIAGSQFIKRRCPKLKSNSVFYVNF